MTDEEKSIELTRSSFAAQMAMLGYEPNGNPKDTVEVVRCKDCWKREFDNCPFYEYSMVVQEDDFFCADGEKNDTAQCLV